MSSAAAEAGDAGGQPGEHAVCRGGAAPGQRQGQEGGKYQELNQCNLTWAWSMAFYSYHVR